MIHVLQSAEKLSKNGQRLKYIYRWKGLGLWYTKKIILIQKFKLYWYFWAKNLKIWGRLAQFFIFFCQKISLPSKSEDAFWYGMDWAIERDQKFEKKQRVPAFEV